MAKSWSGFVPQNHDVLEQWGVMEASRDIIEVLVSLPKAQEAEGNETADSGDIFRGWPYDAE